MNKETQTQANDILETLKNEETLMNKDGKFEQKDLNKVLLLSPLEVRDYIRESLISDDLLQLSSGEASYSQLQRRVKEYFEVKFFEDLQGIGKTSFSITEEEQKSLSLEEEGICILNANGHLIRDKVNHTDVTERRKVDKAKKQMKEMTPSA